MEKLDLVAHYPSIDLQNPATQNMEFYKFVPNDEFYALIEHHHADPENIIYTEAFQHKYAVQAQCHTLLTYSGPDLEAIPDQNPERLVKELLSINLRAGEAWTLPADLLLPIEPADIE
jgi:hypothetical protein